MKKEVKMKIRNARKEDLAQIIALYVPYLRHQRKFSKWLGNSKKKIDIGELTLGIERLISKKGFLFLVAERKNKIQGFVYVEILSAKESRTDKKVAEIVDIYSHIKRKGIGKLLFKEVEKWAKTNNIYYILWEFMTENKNAEKFCIKNGFRDFKTKMLKKV
ncbi:MAG: GNAT family N-acetyltransferase [Nanoarchaeota archaeon]|nr:GNAT family N-acetyltransferase [Nanoarchaeota archaeon]